jgi:glutathione S-transferase
MELYFAPLACSMATRICLYEAGAQARFTQVDTRSKRLLDGGDFLAINPLGFVPVLRLPSGETLTENVAILQYVADQFPQAGLAPAPGSPARYQMQRWLSFIGSELHKVVYTPLLDAAANDGAKSYARDKAAKLLGHLDAHLAGRTFLLEEFSVADAYLAVVLNWSAATGVDLKQWPAVASYHQRMLQRPSIARAFGEELKLYHEQQKRRAAA